jgi:hypothetical protein
MRTTAYRRHHLDRIRNNIIRFVKRHLWKGEELVQDPKWLGNMLSTHGKPCSCSMCSWHKNPDRIPTRQEMLAQKKEREQLAELE